MQVFCIEENSDISVCVCLLCFTQCTVSELLWSKVADRRDEFSSLCGVPYNALPLATVSVVCECVCV